MELITTRDNIKRVTTRWYHNYKSQIKGEVPSLGGLDKKEVYEKLKKLNLETCSASDVDKIIGNTSWTRIKCDGCEKETQLAVIFEHWEDTTTVCNNCIAKANEELKKVSSGIPICNCEELGIDKCPTHKVSNEN